MLYRARSGALFRCERSLYVSDKEYYRAIIATVFQVRHKDPRMDTESLEADKIASLVKTQVCKSRTR